ncbi:MAG: ThiF family adenylyltransferase [Halobacteriaceae archaeon]
MPGLDPRQLDRYSRHVIMDDVGPDGQTTLLDSSALVVGAGGLGSPVIQYLAAAGVGHLTIVDDDTVERSNLQRQVIHRDTDVGTPKVQSAARYVTDLNPDVTVETHETRVDADTADGLVADHDVVLDCSDNFPTRFLLNDACHLAETPLVHGAVYRFEGQVLTITPESGPCYRCLFPEAPPPGTVPDCAEAGVLGAVPGIVGSIQATEALKLMVDAGDVLVGRLLVVDALGLEVETVAVAADPDCPVCGTDASFSALGEVTYEDACTVE